MLGLWSRPFLPLILPWTSVGRHQRLVERGPARPEPKSAHPATSAPTTRWRHGEDLKAALVHGDPVRWRAEKGIHLVYHAVCVHALQPCAARNHLDNDAGTDVLRRRWWHGWLDFRQRHARSLQWLTCADPHFYLSVARELHPHQQLSHQ